MMMDPVVVKCAELMGMSGDGAGGKVKMPTKAELESGVDPLDVDLGFG